jgi:Uma2 family endonuclease
MPVLEQVRLSLDTFHARYADEKHWFEYWDGEAVQKSMPTRLHSLIQKILVKLLDALGYDSGQEITLKLDPNYEPVPDVIAAEGHIGDPYPTEPFEVVIEILSPESPKDSFSRVLRKCHLYANWGIRQVVVIDPKARLIWSFENGVPQETGIVARRAERSISAQQLWDEVDRIVA